jgi:hypothetical protein
LLPAGRAEHLLVLEMVGGLRFLAAAVLRLPLLANGGRLLAFFLPVADRLIDRAPVQRVQLPHHGRRQLAGRELLRLFEQKPHLGIERKPLALEEQRPILPREHDELVDVAQLIQHHRRDVRRRQLLRLVEEGGKQRFHRRRFDHLCAEGELAGRAERFALLPIPELIAHPVETSDDELDIVAGAPHRLARHRPGVLKIWRLAHPGTQSHHVGPHRLMLARFIARQQCPRFGARHRTSLPQESPHRALSGFKEWLRAAGCRDDRSLRPHASALKSSSRLAMRASSS